MGAPSGWPGVICWNAKMHGVRIGGHPAGMKGQDSSSKRVRCELPSKREFHLGDGEALVFAEPDGSGAAGGRPSEPGF